MVGGTRLAFVSDKVASLWPSRLWILLLAVVAFSPLCCLAGLEKCEGATKGSINAIHIDVDCSNTSIVLTMINFADYNEFVPRYTWLEYECKLPNDNFTWSVINNTGGISVKPNYQQTFDEAPLPDGTVCTVRGCYYHGIVGDRLYFENNTVCTIDTNECDEGTHDCGNHSWCNNTVGGYECVCDDGYIQLEDGNCIISTYSPVTSVTATATSPTPGQTPELTQEQKGKTSDNLAVGITVPLILVLLLAMLVAILIYLVWKRRNNQGDKFKHYNFNVESKLNIMHDPGVLKLDTMFRVHSSLYSVYHELTYEREFPYTSASQTTLSERGGEETRVGKGSRDAGVDDTDASGGGGGVNERISIASSKGEESGGKGRDKKPLQLSPISGGDGRSDTGDNNSCPLSPASISMAISSNDSNTSSEGGQVGSLRQSCGDAHSTGYVSENTNIMSMSNNTSSFGGGGISNRGFDTSNNEWEIPVFESLNDPPAASWQPHPSNADSAVESPANGYVSDTKEFCVASRISGGNTRPHGARREDCVGNQTSNRSLGSHYCVDSTSGVGCGGEMAATQTTTTTTQEREPEQACQQRRNEQLMSRQQQQQTCQQLGNVCGQQQQTCQQLGNVCGQQQQTCQQRDNEQQMSGQQQTQHIVHTQQGYLQQHQHTGQHNQQQQQQQIEQQRQQIEQQRQQPLQQQQQQRQQQIEQQQQREEESPQRTDSSLSLNIITDLDQAFPLSTRFASCESLDQNYLPETSLPQMMPTNADLRTFDFGSAVGCKEGGGGGGYIADGNRSSGVVATIPHPSDVATTSLSITAHMTTTMPTDCSSTTLANRNSHHKDPPPPYHVSLHHAPPISSVTTHPSSLSHTRHPPPVSTGERDNKKKTTLQLQPTGVSGGYVNIDKDSFPPFHSAVSSAGNNNHSVLEKPDMVSMDDWMVEGMGEADTTEVIRNSSSSPEACGLGAILYEEEEEEGERGFTNILFGLESTGCHDGYVS